MKLKLGTEPQERAIARILELKMNYWVDTMRADLAKMPQDEANRISEHVMAWADAGKTPAKLPLNSVQVASMSFSYLRDQNQSFAKALWNCEQYMRPSPV